VEKELSSADGRGHSKRGYSPLFDRSVNDQWKEAGGKRFEERLRELTIEAMNHEPAPLATEIIEEMDRMQAHWK